ncbi:WecB/TagA/CpsF family glycosyltransferase [Algoriphagus halophilus]|uniref:N-acetylglucosaminyldiphosphoundecaprenol N-acetyl-beta-D-mannosaminyltransferase n=1 Tax=Algoriphagus halophilus TaxID=226505 RepID=A0A1N6EBI8_9BACT|nr:WecB/TagA/CpsF family glycosyltransferase [Algoriphagus halophilus]SIN80390.1 N-acetylglucosaminyldiphosphoundecaprenol N-acetyl-beta-D-mannosaminyltransferase [Algoriphagus halophilus]
METVNSEFLGYSMYNGKLMDILLKGKTIVNTLNQYSFCLAEEDKNFKNALLQSDVLLPDGISIVLSAKFLSGSEIHKIAGADLHEFILKYLNSVYGSCFYLGSKNETLEVIKSKIVEKFPNVNCGSYSPPFKDSFTEEDNDLMVQKINEFNPDVLFVGMTAPKQEKWVHQNKDRIQATYICSIGAVFDYFSGTIERPNDVWVKYGLEWLGRFMKEPKRLWKRYFLYGLIYVKYISLNKFVRSFKLFKPDTHVANT